MELTPIQRRESAVQNVIAEARKSDADMMEVMAEAMGRVLLAGRRAKHYRIDEAEAAGQHLRDVLVGMIGHGGAKPNAR